MDFTSLSSPEWSTAWSTKDLFIFYIVFARFHPCIFRGQPALLFSPYFSESASKNPETGHPDPADHPIPLHPPILELPKSERIQHGRNGFPSSQAVSRLILLATQAASHPAIQPKIVQSIIYVALCLYQSALRRIRITHIEAD